MSFVGAIAGQLALRVTTCSVMRIQKGLVRSLTDKSKLNHRLNKKNNNDNRFNDILTFVKEHIRYFAAGILLLVLVLVLVKCADPAGKTGGESVAATELVDAESESYQLNAYEDVDKLIQDYFTAYAAGDIDTLKTLATPISDKEQAYISLYSQYVEEYQNINCYTKHGLDAKSYMVAVEIDIKFVDVDTTAPGLDFFYVRTNDDGELYIDNLYSNYNLANQENAFDTSVYSLLLKLINGDEHLALQSEVQERYEEALASDDALATMVNTTIPNAINEWIVQMATEETEEPEETETVTEATEETEEAQETETESESEETEEQQIEPVYATDKVNVRTAADTSADVLGSLDKGAEIGRTGTDGDWSIVLYGGETGYVKSEYLSTEAPAEETDNEAEETTTSTSSLAEGTVITLTDTVNIRESMSETADKVGTAYQGEKVTVQMSYAEGWTKVTWNGKTGYIKSSLLQ